MRSEHGKQSANCLLSNVGPVIFRNNSNPPEETLPPLHQNLSLICGIVPIIRKNTLNLGRFGLKVHKETPPTLVGTRVWAEVIYNTTTRRFGTWEAFLLMQKATKQQKKTFREPPKFCDSVLRRSQESVTFHVRSSACVFLSVLQQKVRLLHQRRRYEHQ